MMQAVDQSTETSTFTRRPDLAPNPISTENPEKETT
jgi:hypothetical protein